MSYSEVTPYPHPGIPVSASLAEELLELRENFVTDPIHERTERSRDFYALYEASLKGKVGYKALARYRVAVPVPDDL